MTKYIVKKEFGGYTAKYPISGRYEYFGKGAGLGAEIKVWKTLRGAENYIGKMSLDDDYKIEIKQAIGGLK